MESSKPPVITVPRPAIIGRFDYCGSQRVGDRGLLDAEMPGTSEDSEQHSPAKGGGVQSGCDLQTVLVSASTSLGFDLSQAFAYVS